MASTPPSDPVSAVLNSLLGGRYIIRLSNKRARPGQRSGEVLDSTGAVIGDASDYIYGGTGFAVHTKAFGGYVPCEQITFTHEQEAK